MSLILIFSGHHGEHVEHGQDEVEIGHGEVLNQSTLPVLVLGASNSITVEYIGSWTTAGSCLED